MSVLTPVQTGSTHKVNLRYILVGLKIFISVLCLSASALSPAFAADTAAVTASSSAESQQQRDRLAQIVLEKLAFYATHYPDIDFVVLDSAGDVTKNMQILAKILGQDPEPLDYAHPEDMRYTLLISMLIRIELLLQTEVGSATLFAPGEGALARRKRVCIVTLNPWAIAADDRTATRHLLDIPQQGFDEISRTRYLDHVSHLRFALDHEIYHCLDANFNGPIPMSHKRYWAGYQMLRNEAGADAFAILMHMMAQGRITQDDRTLKLIRGLSLINGDPDHYTYPAISAALQIDPKQLIDGKVNTCFRLATQIRERVVGSYSDYLRYAAAAERTMRSLGISSAREHYSDLKVDHKYVEQLKTLTRRAYQDLTGHALPAVGK